MSMQYISGNAAAAEAVRLARVEVIAAYPITPQTEIVMRLSNEVFDGKLKAEFVPVEGEHSAMSATVGASLAGARAFTASSAQGLAYMNEVLFYAAGLRLPLVMVVANRSMTSPVTIFADHQDSLPTRDTGFMQFYAESCQDILDLVLMTYRLAEDKRVLLPVMVCCDGFYLSHVMEPVDVPDQADVDRFLPPNGRHYPHIDLEDPKLFNVMAFPEHFGEFARDRYASMERAEAVFDEIAEEFESLFGRKHQRCETYRMEDADYALIGLGSMMGTSRALVDKLREEGHKVGICSVKSYRPFPVKEVRQALSGCKAVGVLDRDVGYGSGGILYLDVCRALFNESLSIRNFILGLGGRDVTTDTLEQCFASLREPMEAGEEDVYWPDTNQAVWALWKEEM
ncbi:MAG TPA: pyruvate ferredoxin oxidoreductase [Clostridia bacterium]|nr:pyruvate ferredoxin oxidoreductase [Clostridia bacterium]